LKSGSLTFLRSPFDTLKTNGGARDVSDVRVFPFVLRLSKHERTL
jgi:hypothetical protein